MEHYNKLTPSQAELLALLAEECAESVQVIGKILRHGYMSKHPSDGPTNIELLEKELGHVCAAMDMLYNSGDIGILEVEASMAEKLSNVKRWLHHQG